MKKLNNKGFTLIELLAVIVILAIIMVVTIPTVLSSMDSARVKTLKNSANSVAEWVEKQYNMATIADSELAKPDDAFTGVCTSGTSGNGYCATTAYQLPTTKPTTPGAAITNTNAVAFLKAAGVDPTNYSYVYVKVDSSNRRACVKLVASSTGQFANATTTDVSSSSC